MAKKTTKELNMNEKVTIICYKKKTRMKRGEAINYYFNGMVCCDGSERERYTNIYQQLILGYKTCSDQLEF